MNIPPVIIGICLVVALFVIAGITTSHFKRKAARRECFDLTLRILHSDPKIGDHRAHEYFEKIHALTVYLGTNRDHVGVIAMRHLAQLTQNVFCLYIRNWQLKQALLDGDALMQSEITLHDLKQRAKNFAQKWLNKPRGD